MLRIGLTGGIGSGKSTVAGFLAGMGCHVIDADALSHQLTAAGGAAMPAIVAAFGPEAAASDGALNRPVMRQWIAHDGAVRRRLEQILHPLIAAAMHSRMRELAQVPAPALVVDIPLLAEAGPKWRSTLDAVWVVDCSSATQVARVQARSGWPIEQIQAVMAAQATRLERLRCADVVIVNDAIDLQQLQALVQQALSALSLRPKGALGG
jgi:dephospho-CoA kinase